MGRQRKAFLFIIDFELRKPMVFKLDQCSQKEVFFDIKGFTNYDYTPPATNIETHISKPVNPALYRKAFSLVQRHLCHGDTYLLNLTFPTEITTTHSLPDIFNAAHAPYKLMYRNNFCVFSPECFVRIKGERIFSYPMKGTIDASLENAEDIILADSKELYEHNTIVDLIRNDISIVAHDVEVLKFRYIEKIKSNNKDLLQVSSEIAGLLPENWRDHIGTMICKLLPAGSISGAPKQKTTEIIRHAENRKRGFYTGIFGIFDGNDLDSAVNIRFMEKRKEKLYFRSGGGITALSDMETEYDEMLNKVYVPLA
jgi:para-aminobenzoate synthetase component 1